MLADSANSLTAAAGTEVSGQQADPAAASWELLLGASTAQGASGGALLSWVTLPVPSLQ